ncbi:MAG: hypothetical protein AAF492_23745 [Verrucomicrobiota bacterium]
MLDFYIGSFWGAMTKVHGTALADKDGVRIVFVKTKDKMNVMDSDFQEITIPWQQIQKFEPDYGFSGHTLSIFTKPPLKHKLLNKDGNAEIKLNVQKKDRDRLEKFVEACYARGGGSSSNDTDDFIDDMQDFLNSI